MFAAQLSQGKPSIRNMYGQSALSGLVIIYVQIEHTTKYLR